MKLDIIAFCIFAMFPRLVRGSPYTVFIIDTFGELRDINDENTDDKKMFVLFAK